MDKRLRELIAKWRKYVKGCEIAADNGMDQDWGLVNGTRQCADELEAALAAPSEPQASQPPAKPAAREPRCTCEEVLTSMDCSVHGHIVRGALSEQKATAPTLQGEQNRMGPDQMGTNQSTPPQGERIKVPLTPKTWQQQAEHFKAVTRPAEGLIWHDDEDAPQGEAVSEPTLENHFAWVRFM